jgi:hypothetical protein
MSRHLRAARAAQARGPAGAVLGASPPATATPDRVAPSRPTAYTVTGRVVRFGNGRPVRNVRVAAYDGNDRDFLGADLTGRDGAFTIRVVAGDDTFGIYVQGARAGVEHGWLGCDKTPKPTPGEEDQGQAGLTTRPPSGPTHTGGVSAGAGSAP